MRAKKWTLVSLKDAVRCSYSIRQVLGKLSLKEAGGNYSQIKKYLSEYKVDTTHFANHPWNKGKHGIGKPQQSLNEILTRNSYYQSFKLKKRLFDAGLKQRQCEECGWCKKASDGRIPLEIDHINGDSKDNRLTNLRILCPNCHSLKPTHRRKNINKARWRNR